MLSKLKRLVNQPNEAAPTQTKNENTNAASQTTQFQDKLNNGLRQIRSSMSKTLSRVQRTNTSNEDREETKVESNRESVQNASNGLRRNSTGSVAALSQNFNSQPESQMKRRQSEKIPPARTAVSENNEGNFKNKFQDQARRMSSTLSGAVSKLKDKVAERRPSQPDASSNENRSNGRKRNSFVTTLEKLKSDSLALRAAKTAPSNGAQAAPEITNQGSSAKVSSKIKSLQQRLSNPAPKPKVEDLVVEEKKDITKPAAPIKRSASVSAPAAPPVNQVRDRAASVKPITRNAKSSLDSNPRANDMAKLVGENNVVLSLLIWAKSATEGYNGVTITNLHSSFANGLALSALVHSYAPHAIDYDNIDRERVEHNLTVAIRQAKEVLGVPDLIEAKDLMVQPRPDQKVVTTYLTEFNRVCKDMPHHARGTATNSSAEVKEETKIEAKTSQETNNTGRLSQGNRLFVNNMMSKLLSTQQAQKESKENSKENTAVRRESTEAKSESKSEVPKAQPNISQTQPIVSQIQPGGEQCNLCGNSTSGSEIMEVGEMKFHKETCFKCATCNKKFWGKGFMPVNGKLYCDKCGREAFVAFYAPD